MAKLPAQARRGALYLAASRHISPHLATSRRISPHLAHISPTSPQALRGLPGGERVQRPPDIPFSKDGGKGLAARAERVQRSPSP